METTHDRHALSLSVIVPVYNEASVLPVLLRTLQPVLLATGWKYEIVFVNDGSRDGSLRMLLAEAAMDERIKVLSFPRNFGHQTAVTAGLDFASGDAVIILDADLQDPPELIPEMLQLYLQGYEVVSPQRISRKGEAFFKRGTASLFYWLIHKFVDNRIHAEVGDFRLLSRAAVNALRQFREQHRFLRGLITWLGLREALLPFHRQPRAAGETKYPLLNMLRFSLTAITSFSALPLRCTMIGGIAASGVSLLYFGYAAYGAFVLNRVVPGWTSIVFLQCLFFGITLLGISAIGEYVGRIYEEAKFRPLYILDHVVNLRPATVRRIATMQPRETPVPEHELLRLREKVGSSV
ncbi:MAG: glycosyltransferase family 2 protein [Bryobacteraceae bacterium]